MVDKWRYAGEESSEREIRILSKVSHANCIQMHAVFVTARRVYIVTDLVTGGELLDKCAAEHVRLRTCWLCDIEQSCALRIQCSALIAGVWFVRNSERRGLLLHDVAAA